MSAKSPQAKGLPVAFTTVTECVQKMKQKIIKNVGAFKNECTSEMFAPLIF